MSPAMPFSSTALESISSPTAQLASSRERQDVQRLHAADPLVGQDSHALLSALSSRPYSGLLNWLDDSW